MSWLGTVKVYDFRRALYDYVICDESGKEIGRVTSGTQSPTLQKAIGMGYVTKEHAAENSFVFVKVRDKLLKAQVIKLPFLKKAN